MTQWNKNDILGYVFVTTMQVGAVFLALAFATWAGKMFIRALNY